MSHRLAPHDRARGAMKRCHLALGVLGEDPPKANVMGGRCFGGACKWL
jgi:hypothetical protein